MQRILHKYVGNSPVQSHDPWRQVISDKNLW